jgi:hypothetical protein
MAFVTPGFRWPGDPAPGRSALDERLGTSNKPADQTPDRPLRRRTTITLPRSAGEFSRVRLPMADEAEVAIQ